MKKIGYLVLFGAIALLFVGLIPLTPTIRAEPSNATVTGITFGQINFNLTGGYTPYSGWGDAHVSFYGSAYAQYLNLISNGYWTIQNLPVLSVEGEGVNQTQDFWFPLDAPSGTPVTTITYGIQLTNDTLTVPPTQNASAPVSGEDYVIYSGEAGGALNPTVPPAAPVVGGAVKDQAKHENFPNQEAGLGECVPTAISNSLKFLNKKFNLGIDENKLSIEKMKDATKWTKTGLAPSGWWNNKDTYMEANNLPITTKVIQSGDIGKILGEIKAGEDVEMGLTDAIGHRVAVVGIADLGGGKYSVTIKHDKKQGPAGAQHDLATETGVWDSKTGTWSGDLGIYTGIINFVVESPRPGVSTPITSPFTISVLEDGRLVATPSNQPVIPGDVVVLENSGGSLSDPSTWSDVLRFSDNPTGPNPFPTHNVTHYQLFSEKQGAPGFVDEYTGFAITPAMLSTNVATIVEFEGLAVYGVSGTNVYYIYSNGIEPVGGISFSIPVDKSGSLTPYIGLTSITIVAAVATAICVKRVKRRKEKQ